jgi:hypothetical protein
MSQPADTARSMPAHLRPLTVDIPRTWTPEEALVVYQLIEDLRPKVSAIYESQLQEMLRAQRADLGDDKIEFTLDEGSL